MTLDAWVSVAVALATGFGIWMFRIDRICTRLESKLDEVNDWRTATANQLSGHGNKLDDHAVRLARMEARREQG
jgi:hypothetical protein